VDVDPREATREFIAKQLAEAKGKREAAEKATIVAENALSLARMERDNLRETERVLAASLSRLDVRSKSEPEAKPKRGPGRPRKQSAEPEEIIGGAIEV
jgi:hypothetical protein